MPELPEVETIRRGLAKFVLGKTIKAIKIFKKRSLKNKPDFLIKSLIGNSFLGIMRKGKVLIFETKKGQFLVVRLGMTGQLVYSKNLDVNKHTRISIYFEDKSRIIFNDIRRFGYMKILDEKEKKVFLEKIGIDPLSKDFTFERFKDLIKNKKSSLKSFLLNQKHISGIGNIYADEICFEAGLLPQTELGTLSDKKIKKLYNAIVKILSSAVTQRGTTFSNYVDSTGKKGNFSKFLRVYRKNNQFCKNCKSEKIKRIKLAGRSTHYCKHCQK